MKAPWGEIERRHLVGRDPAAHRVATAIEATADRQAFRGRGVGDQPHDGLIIAQGLAAPIGRDERKEPMFHLVPFAREMLSRALHE